MTMAVRYFRVTFHHQDFTVTTCVNNLTTVGGVPTDMHSIDENTDVTTAHNFAVIAYVASANLTDTLPFVGQRADRGYGLVHQAKNITIDEIKSDGEDWFTAEVIE